MKKYIFTIVLAIFPCFMMMSQVKFGITAGVDVAQLDGVKELFGSKGDAMHSASGWFAGPKLELFTPLGLGAEVMLLYSEFDGDNESQQFLELPLNLKYNIGVLKVVSPYLLVGASACGNLDDYGDYGRHNSGFSKVDWNLNLGAGIRLVKHLQLGVTYQYPLGSYYTYEDVYTRSSRRGSKWRLSLAYLF